MKNFIVRSAVSLSSIAAASMLLAVYSTPARADGTPPKSTWKLGFAAEGGVEFGGDKVATVSFTDGSEQSVKTGDGVTLSGGGHLRLSPSWDVRTTVGYKYVTTKANNADIHLDRIVVKGVADYFFNNSKWYLGGGIVHHANINFDAGGLGPNLSFSSATGAVIEGGWSFVAVTYTLMSYKDEAGNKYGADSIGISLIGRF